MKNNFIRSSIMGVLAFLKESIFADEYALKKGFLQSLDPRVKTITLLLFILQSLFIKNIPVLIGYYLISLILALFSKINLGFFLKRTWFFIPIFSLFIAIPALFNIFSPGQAILRMHIFGLQLVITQQGLFGSLLFVLRVITCVSFAVLLSITTRHFTLLKVLRIFKIPKFFVMTLGMCYRYIFLFIGIVENTYLAIKSRVGVKINYQRGQHIVAGNISYLWQRSFQLNEEVYKAMLSRGYDGEPQIINNFKTSYKDWLWFFVTLGILLCLR